MSVDYPLDAIRSSVPFLASQTYLNTGTVGLMNENVLRDHLTAISDFERRGHHGAPDARAAYRQSRERLATLIGARSHEIGLNRNASDGINWVVNGLSLSPESVVLTTAEEHPAVFHPLSALARHGGPQVHVIPIGASDDEIIARFDEALESFPVSLVIFSHVSCETGVRLPARSIIERCHAHDALVLLDGAQSVGQFHVDVGELGCDFMTGNGHKWLCGPKGTGFLYAREDLIDQLVPAYVGDGSIEPRFERQLYSKTAPTDGWNYALSAERFEFGTRNWHHYAALGRAIDDLESVGFQAIETHCDGVSSYAKSQIERLPGVTLFTPSAWSDSSGLITFGVEGRSGEELSSVLWNEHSIIQRRVQVPSAVRISCAYYTSNNDIDRLVDALESITGSRRT